MSRTSQPSGATHEEPSRGVNDEELIGDGGLISTEALSGCWVTSCIVPCIFWKYGVLSPVKGDSNSIDVDGCIIYYCIIPVPFKNTEHRVNNTNSFVHETGKCCRKRVVDYTSATSSRRGLLAFGMRWKEDCCCAWPYCYVDCTEGGCRMR